LLQNDREARRLEAFAWDAFVDIKHCRKRIVIQTGMTVFGRNIKGG